MDKNIFSIDRIEDNLVILENIETKEKIEEERELLPINIHEGSIIKIYNNSYILDENIESKRRNEILERFKNLRKNR